MKKEEIMKYLRLRNFDKLKEREICIPVNQLEYVIDQFFKGKKEKEWPAIKADLKIALRTIKHSTEQWNYNLENPYYEILEAYLLSTHFINRCRCKLPTCQRGKNGRCRSIYTSFEVKIPNEETRRAIEESVKGKGLIRCKDADDFFNKLEF